jgi:nucleotide-binding universal stress UspA family protein
MKVLLATDGSPCSAGAQQFLALLPLAAGSTIDIVAVLDEVVGPTAPALEEGTLVWQTREEIQEFERKQAWEWVRQAEAAVARGSVQTNGAVRRGDAAHQILLAAEEVDADLIAVGSHGRTGFAAFVLGSVARNVAQHATQPVLVARAPRNRLRQVVLAVDGSPHAEAAVRLLARLPFPAETAVTACNVVRPRDPHPWLALGAAEVFIQAAGEANFALLEAGSKLVEAARSRLADAGKTCFTMVREGDPAETLSRLADERQADLIAAGARGVSLIQGLVVGSVADRLLKSAPCSVLIVH